MPNLPDDGERARREMPWSKPPDAPQLTNHANDTNHTVSPRAIVQLSIDEITRMAERATNVYKALNFLVDLKQKQSNVMDARSTRIQAEESLKMSKENDRQGKTLMVFTIVTIVFLPMSFMASFLALNITQFQRDRGGTLNLSYVSEIMFPISAAITAFLIYVAFKVESIGKLVTWMKKKVESVGRLVTWMKKKVKREKKAIGDPEP